MNAKNILAVVDLFSRRVLPVCALMLAGGVTTQAATWDGGTAGNGTDWGTVANWVGDVLPADTETISFSITNPTYGYPAGVTNGSVTVTNINTYGLQVGQAVTGTGISGGTTIVSIGTNSITLSNAFTGTTGSANIVVANVGGLASSPTISLGASRTINALSLNNSNTFTLGSASDIASGYGLTLSNVTRGGSTAVTIAANLTLAPNVTGKSTWKDTSNGTTTVTGAVYSTESVILNKGGTGGNGTLTLNGANTFTGSIVVDNGILSLGGTNAYTGTTTASGGTLTVNFNANAAATPLTNIINSSSALVLGGVRGGGTVTTNGKAGATVSQSFNGTTLNAGASSFTIVNGSTANTRTLVNLGSITRNAGSTVAFAQPTGTGNTTVGATNGYTTSTGNDASGILGGYATTGNDWATNNGTNIVAYTGYTADTWAAGANTNVTADATVTADSTTNSLRFNTAAARTLTLSGTNTLTSGGILVGSTVANNLTTITGGTLQGSSGGELIIHQNNSSNSLTIASNIGDNTTATALTKSGAGNLNLTGTLSYTGGTYVNAGTLTLVAGSTDPLVTTGAITVTGGTLALGASTAQTVTGTVTIAGGTISGGTLTNNGTALDARNGTISAKLAGTGGINKSTSGTLTLSNTTANTFTGTTTITEGSLVAASAASVIGVGGNLVVGSSSGGNPASYSVGSSNNIGWATGKTLTVYSNGSVNFSNGAQTITGAAVINILGGSVTGSQIYTQSGATYNLTGGTLTGSFFSAGASYNILASSETSTIGIGTSAGSQTFNVANGAAATDLSYTGSLSGANNLTKNSDGFMLATGSSSYTGITTVSGGTLAVTTLANGGANSSIGASAVAASNLKLGNGTTLQYTGTGHSTDRLFTINGSSAGHAATLEASGSGAVNFTNTGSIAYGTTAQTRTLNLGGTSTADNTLAALIANNGGAAVSLTKQDAGKWILTNTNTYTGATAINGGTLVVNGSLASGSAVSIGALGTLGGSGTVGGTVAVTGTISPGTSPGTLTTGAETWNVGGTYVWEINDATGAQGTNWDFISSTGALDITALSSSGKFNVNVVGLTAGNVSGAVANWTDADVSWKIASFTSITGTFASDLFNVDASGFTNNNPAVGVFNVTNIGGDIFLTYTAVPEPSTCAALAGALVLACATLRRRRA